ncbi:MAG: polyprenyl synthetase family protein [Candidatus Aenigmatarchaeota archaeon]
MKIKGTEIDDERMEKAVKELKKWREKVNKELEEEFELHKKRAKNIHPEGVKVIDYLEDYTMRGGKRVRPALIIAGYKAVGGKEPGKIVPASLSIEALQSYLLIHDDIMDEDEVRRGDTTLHKMYEQYHDKKFPDGRAEKFGENMGIIVGDIANSFAVAQLIKSDFDCDTKMKALEKFEQIHRHTGYGQVLDVTFNEKSLEEIDEEDVLTVHYLKTSQYTMAGPLELGVIFARGNEDQRKILKKYGEKAGKAFQIYDDMLGLYGDEEKLGKPIASDLEEGKKTLLMVKAYENGDEEQRKKLKEALGKKDITEEEVKEVRDIVKETGSYDYSREMTVKLAEEAKQVLDESKLDPKIVKFLGGLADYIVTREV